MDFRQLRSWVRDEQSKTQVEKPQSFWKHFDEVMGMIEQWLHKVTLNLGAGWVLDQARRINPQRPRTGIVPGNIVEVELGIGFDGEYAFQHPCLVLRKSGPLLTVVPLTSKDEGKGIIVTDHYRAREPVCKKEKYWWRVEFHLPGYDKASIALIEQVRTVSEKRVQAVWYSDADGSRIKVSESVLEAVQERVTAMLAPSVWSRYNDARKKLRQLRRSMKQDSLRGT